MKRLLTVGFFWFGLSLGSTVFAVDSVDAFIWLFETAPNAVDRFALLDESTQSSFPEIGRLYARALGLILYEQPSLGTAEQKRQADLLTSRVSQLLGEKGDSTGAADLWRVVQTFTNPTVQADALTALGRLRAMDQYTAIKALLSQLNQAPGSDPASAEIVAVGAIRALGHYGETSAGLPLFEASNSWYSDRTKILAKTIFEQLNPDPALTLRTVLMSGAADIRWQALKYIDQSSLAGTAKGEAALLALSTALTGSIAGVSNQAALAQLRNQAITMLIRYGSDQTAVELLKKSYRQANDIGEKLLVLSALARNSSDEAALTIADFLEELSARRQSDTITTDDERLIRATIQSAAINGHPKLAGALINTRLVGWSDAINRLASDALQQLRR